MPPRKRAAADPESDQRSPLVGSGLGQVAYEAHAASLGGKSPTWDHLVKSDHDEAAAWCAAAQAVITATIERSPDHGRA